MARGRFNSGSQRFHDTKGRFIKAPPGAVSFFDELGPNIDALPVVTVAAVNEFLHAMADEVESWMQDNAPWDDRTGEARSGLTAKVAESATAPRIDLYHTVSYGLWLEVRWSGKYAIIVPAVEHFGGEIMTRLREIL